MVRLYSHIFEGLHFAAQQGRSDSCHTLLEHAGGSLANELDDQGQTALFHAVESGSLECVQYLLGVGFSPNHINTEQRRQVYQIN